MSNPSRLTIATRESPLALWQAEHVRSLLQQLYPAARIELLGMTTQGDQILDQSLSKIGGKGLFVKELEIAMADGRADLAVHSMKDVPAEMPEGFVLTAIGPREDPHDALVSNHWQELDELPTGAIVGTASLRRESQLRAHRPDLQIRPLRGNVGTRLRKLDEGEFDAIILAAAGLRRLGLDQRIRSTLTPRQSLPAVGQGALGIEIRAGQPELAAWLAPLNDPTTAACVTAERMLSRRLGGSCQVPLGGYAERDGDRIHLRGFVAKPDGSRILGAEAQGPWTQPEAIGSAVALELLAQGAGDILRSL